MKTFTRSVVTEALIHLDGQPFRLDDYPFYRDIYDKTYKKMLLKCGRQVCKSTTMNNMAVVNSVAQPHFRTLYLAPSQNQATVFSTSRLDPCLKFSPEIRDKFLLRDSIMNQSLKRFRNGAEIRVLYASDNADRVRGISTDRIDYDEVQDMVLSAISPVVDECMANSRAAYGFTCWAGTPKSMENGIEVLWQQSTQDEWVVKCTGCATWNALLTTKSIGKTGPICLKCGKNLNVREGRWHSMNPRGNIKGYHVSQLILPLNSEEPARWDRLLSKVDSPLYSETTFNNEVLGISDASGTRMLSLEELEANCRDYALDPFPTAHTFEDIKFTVAGVDWSGGGSATFTSRTAIWVWGMLSSGRLKLLYYKVFQTNNPVADVRAVAEIAARFKCVKVAGDAGGGAVANAMLAELLGTTRVMQIQYGANSSMLAWNNHDRYMADKTSAIDSMMLQFKTGQVFFPQLAFMKQAFEDILAEHEQITQSGSGRRIWSHSPLVPDDALHAAVFGWLASMVEEGRVEFYPMPLGGS